MEDKDVQHYIEHKLKSFPKVEQICSMHSIVVTPNLLADLEKAIKKNIPNDSCQIRYICKYKKKADAYFNSIQELDGCDNSLDRTIKTLVMEVSAGKDFSAELTFGMATLEDLDYAYYDLSVPTPVNVHGYVKGKEKQIAKLKADIIYQIRRHSRKSLYSFFSYAGVLFTILLTIGLYVGYRYLWGIPKTYSIPIMNIVDKPYNSAALWGKIMPYTKLWLTVFGLAICIGDFFRQIFPRVQFILGDNRDAVKRKRTTKDRILWDILFAFILNLAILFIEHNI